MKSIASPDLIFPGKSPALSSGGPDNLLSGSRSAAQRQEAAAAFRRTECDGYLGDRTAPSFPNFIWERLLFFAKFYFALIHPHGHRDRQ